VLFTIGIAEENRHRRWRALTAIVLTAWLFPFSFFGWRWDNPLSARSVTHDKTATISSSTRPPPTPLLSSSLIRPTQTQKIRFRRQWGVTRGSTRQRNRRRTARCRRAGPGRRRPERAAARTSKARGRTDPAAGVAERLPCDVAMVRWCGLRMRAAGAGCGSSSAGGGGGGARRMFIPNLEKRQEKKDGGARGDSRGAVGGPAAPLRAPRPPWRTN
jgi:hypothetical protein